MTRENAEAKSRRYLAEGRIILQVVRTDRVYATARGEGHLWQLGYSDGRWWCRCPARSERCSHLLAVRKVVAVDVDEPVGLGRDVRIAQGDAAAFDRGPAVNGEAR